MTDQTNDRKHPSETPGGTEGQDTSENMDQKSTNDPDTTEVLPAQATPPTQKITLDDTGRAPEAAAPEGEVHPAYGIAAARVEAEAAAAEVHDAPVRDDSDPLAPLRGPAPGATSTPSVTPPPSGNGPAAAQPAPAQGRPAAAPQGPAHPGQAVQTAQTAAPKRGPRVGTAVWGLIVIAVGLGILAVAAGVVFDLGVALIVLLGAAGVILVAGSVISSVRRR